jgi:hypothetical protein
LPQVNGNLLVFDTLINFLISATDAVPVVPSL